jgi:protein-tyrosine phosphatase
MKILMVCLGNICRSPLAEGILRDKIKKAGLNWEVDSAGTDGYQPGCPPHHFSQKVAKHFGIDISTQKCRDFRQSDIEAFDRIYVMDDENYDEVRRISGKKWKPEKVDLLLNEVYPGKDKIVPDPWFGGEDGFYTTYKMIEEACDMIVRKYKDQTLKESYSEESAVGKKFNH